MIYNSLNLDEFKGKLFLNLYIIIIYNYNILMNLTSWIKLNIKKVKKNKGRIIYASKFIIFLEK